MNIRATLSSALIGATLCLAQGCGTAAVVDVNGPYEDGATVVVTKDGSQVLPSDCAPSLPGCAPDGDATKACPDGQGPADVVVRDGKVVVAVCYPDPNTSGKQVVSPGDIKGVKSNGGVVTFDPAGDGKAYEDDLTVEGNGNVVFGNGADKTIIDGDAILKGNNNRLRGVTVTGKASFEGNNVSVVLSIIEGDLIIKGNNAIIADVVVLGDLKVEGNNNVMMRVFVAGKVDVKGDNNQCLESAFFEDKDKDGLWDSGEEGEAWTCK